MLCGCQSFLYPLITDANAVEEPKIEGTHHWRIRGDDYQVVISKVAKTAYKAVVTAPEGKVDLLVRLTKIKGQLFFQLSSYPVESLKKLDEQAGEGMEWVTLVTLTQRPNYLIGKVVSFEPHLRITFFDVLAAGEKHWSEEMADSYHSYPRESSGGSGPGALVIVPPDKLRAYIERAADDPKCFQDLGFAE